MLDGFHQTAKASMCQHHLKVNSCIGAGMNHEVPSLEFVSVRFRFWAPEEPLGFDERGHPAVEARALSANFEEDHPGVLPTL